MVPFPPVRVFAYSATFATACLGAAVFTLALVSTEEPRLAAATNYGRSDMDRDGLTDLQELILGTMPGRKDTDQDGYSDLEELARGSDMKSRLFMPQPQELGLGMCASQENGYISIVTAVYVSGLVPDTSGIQFGLGIVYHGKRILISPDKQISRAFLYKGHTAGDSLAVIEMGISQDLLKRLGQVNVFTYLHGTGIGAPEPAVAILPIKDFSGIAVSIQERVAPLSSGGGGATGVVYRPLAADDQIPSSWNSGEICFQATSAVGINGVSVVSEINAADCLPMDTYCSPGDCAATIGTALEMPDPAALAGG